MSATQPDSGDRDFDAVRRAQRVHEPSMEEILASIRAIIADDRESIAAKATAAAPPPPAAKTPSGPQIIYSTFGGGRPSAELPPRAATTQDAPGAPAPNAMLTRSGGEARSELPALSVRPATAAAKPSLPVRELPPESALLSKQVESRVSASFQSLAGVLAPPDPKRLDEMAREMLRPMLKAWLDENLPVLVERLVSAEIQRVSRGGR
jgi:cell pole-organizing protein PopZ